MFNLELHKPPVVVSRNRSPGRPRLAVNLLQEPLHFVQVQARLLPVPWCHAIQQVEKKMVSTNKIIRKKKKKVFLITKKTQVGLKKMETQHVGVWEANHQPVLNKDIRLHSLRSPKLTMPSTICAASGSIAMDVIDGSKSQQSHHFFAICFDFLLIRKNKEILFKILYRTVKKKKLMQKLFSWRLVDHFFRSDKLVAEPWEHDPLFDKHPMGGSTAFLAPTFRLLEGCFDSATNRCLSEPLFCKRS